MKPTAGLIGGFLEPHGTNCSTLGVLTDAADDRAQLVSIVRVLHKDPQVVVLDEIASRLDPQTEAALEEALGHLLEGRTAIVIAHRRKTLERVDDILVLADGEAVEYGPRAFLAADPASRFSRLLREGQEVSG